MSIWARIAQAVSALARGESVAALFDAFRVPPERSVTFTIAVIALGAKMAKADGEVTRNEVRAFRRIFTIPKHEERHAAQVFNLARRDIVGFDSYARKIGQLLKDEPQLLADVLEGLFHIAVADGKYHPRENEFLYQVAEIFGLGEVHFRALRARFVDGAVPDPYEVLGVAPDAPDDAVRQAWRKAVLASHPDGMIARGVPIEAIALAEARLAAVNAAWTQVNRDRAA